MSLRVDPEREHLPESGIYICAVHPVTERSVFCDLAHLTRESLLVWLRDHDRDWAHDIIGVLLGHGHLSEEGER